MMPQPPKKDPRNPWKDWSTAAVAAVAIAVGLEIHGKYVATSDVISKRVALLLVALAFVMAGIITLYFLLGIFDIKGFIRKGAIRFYFARSAKRPYSQLVRRWMKFIQNGPDPRIWRIRSAIAKEYIEQERCDLSGAGDLKNRRWNEDDIKEYVPEGRPLVITSFVRYSQLVKALVGAAARSRQDKRSTIVCVTTLSISLEKWFNFDERYNCINPDWETYLTFLRSEVKKAPTTKVIVVRILLVKGPSAKDPYGLLRSEPELRDDLGRWIWLTREGDNPDPQSQKPAELMPTASAAKVLLFERLKALPGVDKGVLDRLASATLNNASYVILPRESIPDSQVRQYNGEFAKLGDQFIKYFHTLRPDGGHHAYYAVVDPGKFTPDWGVNTAPVPVDIFYVGLLDGDGGAIDDPAGAADRITPLFCLGARPPDQHVQTVYLYLFDPYKCHAHFQGIHKHVKELLGHAQPLHELMK